MCLQKPQEHHELTTKKPQKHHQKIPVFLKTPVKTPCSIAKKNREEKKLVEWVGCGLPVTRERLPGL